MYYTSKEDSDVDIFAKNLPSIGDLIDKKFYVGRRIPFVVNEVGAWLGIRVCSYKPQYMKNGNFFACLKGNSRKLKYKVLIQLTLGIDRCSILEQILLIIFCIIFV